MEKQKSALEVVDEEILTNDSLSLDSLSDRENIKGNLYEKLMQSPDSASNFDSIFMKK